MYTTIYSRLKYLALAIAAVFIMSPVAALAQTVQTAQCTINGKPGVYVSIKVNGQNCIPIGNTVSNNVIVTVLGGIVQFLAVGVGLAVTAGIIYGGFLYITARGNTAQTEKGRDTIANSIVGLLLFIFMAAILNFLLGVNVFR